MLRLIRFLVLPVFIGLTFIAASCGDDDDDAEGSAGGGSSSGTLYMGGIPDQDVAILEERFNLLADYLTEATGMNVEYLPSTDYAAVVTASATAT